MPDIQDVYRKFGEASEAIQLLETEVGNLLLEYETISKDLLTVPNNSIAMSVLEKINKSTLGQLLKDLAKNTETLELIQGQVDQALKARNELVHSFFRKHNNRRNTDKGCDIMLKDLENLHQIIFAAYKSILLCRGIDLDALVREGFSLEKRWLPI